MEVSGLHVEAVARILDWLELLCKVVAAIFIGLRLVLLLKDKDLLPSIPIDLIYRPPPKLRFPEYMTVVELAPPPPLVCWLWLGYANGVLV